MSPAGRMPGLLWALLALLCGLALTLGFRHMQRQRQLSEQHSVLQREADEIYGALEESMQRPLRLLRFVQTLYLTVGEVPAAEFAHMYENLAPRKQMPELIALAYARRVVRPDGVRFVTEQFAPVAGNEALAGLVVDTQPANLAVLLASRDSDQPTLSAPFRLVQPAASGKRADAVAMRLPIFGPGEPPHTLAERRARMIGSVAMSLRLEDLIASALPVDRQNMLQMQVSDVTGGHARMLFKSPPAAALPLHAAEPVERFERDLVFGGRTWKVKLQANEPLPGLLDWSDPVLPAGVLSSMLLALLVWSLLETQRRALELGWRMSRSYRESEKRFRYQATHDELTGLCNRSAFESRLKDLLAGIGTQAPASALLYIDLDQFKLINDTNGHTAGDQLLIRLAAEMREQLSGNDVLARLGGDEFGVLAVHKGDVTAVRQLAECLRRCIEGYVFKWEQYSHGITASIGVALIEQPDCTLQDLLVHADTACSMAKEQGRNRVHIYAGQHEQTLRRRREMEWASRLRRAIDGHRLVLAYQEVWPLLPTVAVGVQIELLLRYRDKTGQLVLPGEFLPAAERYGLMPMIDRWVVESALANFAQLHPAGSALQLVAINLSGASIEDDALADRIIELLQRYRVPPQQVCFEITETIAVGQLTQVARFMARLRAVGCKVALDDFGTGMSSFTYLKNLPVDVIKIDGSFIQDMHTDPISHAMVCAVADIGRRLSLEVVAEWVNDEATERALVELGIALAQGNRRHVPELVLCHRQ